MHAMYKYVPAQVGGTSHKLLTVGINNLFVHSHNAAGGSAVILKF